MREVEQDPAAREALQRCQQGLCAAAAHFQSEEFRRELERGRREEQDALERLAEQIRQTIRALGDELTARGFKTPRTLEEWEHLARIVEMPFETIRSGGYTFRDVYVMALAWIDRQQLREHVAKHVAQESESRHSLPAQESRPATRAYTVAALREMTSLGNTTLNEYAKKAGVTTPRRGQRNFRYTEADVRRILTTIIELTAERRILARCQAALARLENTK